ncbi:hypothetical protein [Xanthomonas campestris]|uniref:hypothetical protein n=1 Tax=Xanthomonas campestris TaxID=339 RepID=UPI002B23A5B2|nr:hypothetical protein [Xanthomonas campestris]MEA9491649.1 hypothetical protein [Xanthomonas campestris]MEA9510260.1 hypothetical protein [Xanthomonas campestris]
MLTKSLRSAGVAHSAFAFITSDSLAPCQARTGGSGARVSRAGCADACRLASKVNASRLARAGVQRGAVAASPAMGLRVEVRGKRPCWGEGMR